MIRAVYPQSWTADERRVYAEWTNGTADLDQFDQIILRSCFERVRKGDKPWAELIPDHQPDPERDGYDHLERHTL